MKKQKISLNNAAGGFNDLVTPAGLSEQELAILENYYTDNNGVFLKKRDGQELAQYAPIDPQPFNVDANTTIALWHLDEPTGAGTWNSETNSTQYELRSTALTIRPNDGITAVSGIFPIGAPIAQTFSKIDQVNDWTGGVLVTNPIPSALNGLSAVTFDCWINIPSAYSGGPVANNPVNGVTVPPADLANSNLALIGSAIYKDPVHIGLTLNRDYDFTGNIDTSGPYVTFKLDLLGYGPVTLRTLSLATGVQLHIRGEYDSATGVATLRVNGNVQNTVTIPGAHPLTEIGNYGFVIGGRYVGNYGGTDYWTGWEGSIDEVMVSSTVFPASATPYKRPRGQGFEFAKSDGTRQAVVSADSGLYYTIGNSEWTKMGDGFSTTAYWDAVFYKDILYLSNGIDAPKAWDGYHLVDWMAPTVAPQVLEDGNGNVSIGTHLFAYSYVYGDYETGLSPYATFNSANNDQLTIYGIPGRLNNCTGVRIYATKANSSDFFLVREVPNVYNGTIELRGTAVKNGAYDTDTGNFDLKDSDISAGDYPPIAAEVMSAQSPNPRYLVAAHDRVFVCGMGNESYKLRWSELAAPDVFHAFSFANAAANGGNLIAIAEYYGEIHASKDGNATLVLRGDSPSTWQIFETLHPNIGCIDHWGYVHRYLVNEDRYTLCFPGRDGFYEYAGQQIQKISDRIRGTVDNLAQANAKRNQWDVETTQQFQAQLVGGSNGLATQNVSAPTYEQDGMRQKVNQVSIVNQLDYIGLWGASKPLVPGNVIAVVKGTTEGEFWFSTDADNTLYYTPDNFVTVQPHATQMDPAERIIEIVQKGTVDFFYLLTDKAGPDKSSAGGRIWGYDVTADVFNLVNGTPLFYDNDVPYKMFSQDGNYTVAFILNSPINNNPLGFAQITGFGPQFKNTKNIYINHKQKLIVRAHVDVNTFGGRAVFPLYYAMAPSIDSPAVGSDYIWISIYTNSYYSDNIFDANSVGFLQLRAPKYNSETGGSGSEAKPLVFETLYTRREFAAWQGGTYRPMAYWDQTNNHLVFIASNAPDSNNNKKSVLRYLDSSNNITDVARPGTVCSFATDGTRLWWVETDHVPGATFTPGPANNSIIYQTTLAALGTITLSRPYNNYESNIRLAYDDTSNNVLIISKVFNQSATQEYWTYKCNANTIVLKPDLTTGPISKILDLEPNANEGPIVKELSKQTTQPYSLFGVVDKPTDVAIYAFSAKLNEPLVGNSIEGRAYTNPSTLIPVSGIISNALFVPASGAPGNYLWADRLYWMASGSTLASFGSSSDIRSSTSFDAALNLSTQVTYLKTQPKSTNGALPVQGTVTVNGINVDWNITTQSLADILNNIQLAVANVEAVYNPVNGTVIISSLNAGPLSLADAAGNLLSVLNLPNGSISASSGAGNGRFVQHGVPGVWRVQGLLRSETHDLAVFSAFDSLNSTFNNMGNNNGVLFYLRNAVDIVTTLATPFVSVKPNSKINGFIPAQPIVQWELDFTWDYNYNMGTLASGSPYVRSVDLGYFLGTHEAPRIIGAHYRNRTYWSVATSNSSVNNLVLVYQKNGSWAKIVGWNMISMFMFRNQLYGCSDYRFLRLESGATDDGKLIRGRARTGQMIGPVDKLLTAVQANVSSLVNTPSQTGPGWVKIVPCIGSTPIDDAAWAVQIPNGNIVEPQRILGVPWIGEFQYAWARSFALELRTSEDTAGPYVALVNQPEEIQSVDVVLELTGETYDLPVK